ncbi:hypothetical protein NFI96_014607 [Prochilodus magdalenae]|nr:hypothetical protein NFI96_014607 [Prochilodus magdalenae]
MDSQTKETQQHLTDEANGHIQMISEDSIEYRLLQAYTQSKDPAHSHLLQSNGVAEPKLSSKKRKKTLKLRKLLRCIQPTKEDDICVTESHGQQPNPKTSAAKQEVEDIVSKLTKILESVHLIPSEIECDSNDNIDRIVEILREQGDKLNEEIENNPELMEKLNEALTYSYFKKLTRAFFRRLSPDEVPPESDPKEARIALICELTHRLKIMDRHPMNRVLGFGATYLQDQYSSWVNKQGGYGKVFCDNDEEEVQ